MKDKDGIEENILANIDEYIHEIEVEDMVYASPKSRSFKPDISLLIQLTNMSLSDRVGPTVTDKARQSGDFLAVLGVRDALRKETDWPGFVSFLWRDNPDSRGKRITFMHNRETLAVTLAVRMGIQAELAVALAHHDLLYAGATNGEDSILDFHDAVLLGTFTKRGTYNKQRYGLFARYRAAEFESEFRKGEFALLHQCPRNGLFHGVKSYNAKVLNQMWRCRTSESVEGVREPVSSSKAANDTQAISRASDRKKRFRTNR